MIRRSWRARRRARADRLRRGLLPALAACLASGLVLASCASPGAQADPDRLLVWTLDAQPDRVAKAKEIAAAFTSRTGVTVDVVGVDEAQFPQLIAGAAQSDGLPDVIGSIPLGLTRQLDDQEILDRQAATDLVGRLGRDTFNERALSLTSEGDQVLAVPSDAWTQILVYRTDLFEQRGLAPPTTYAAMEQAAAALTGGGEYGMTLSTDPSDAFTQQTFEALALGNGCQLVDTAGEVALESPACQESFRLYGSLATSLSPKGRQDVDSTRASYFAGQSAMVWWSSYLLDELAGLRDDALPTCPQCESDPTWLAKNSGIVTDVKGPNAEQGSTGGFGEIASWAVTQGPRSTNAAAFAEYVMTDGYQQWLAIAPEGKVPVRNGPTPGSRRYLDAWSTLEVGVDRQAPLASIYPQDVVDELRDSPSTMNRWAIPQGQGQVIGPVTAELPIAKAISELAGGSLDPAGAAAESADAVREITSGMTS